MKELIAQGPVDVNVRALPDPGITTALILDEVGRKVPVKLIGAYYTADQMREHAKAATHDCADTLSINRSEAQLMAGEMSASEWRTVAAILRALQSRMRSNAEVTGGPLAARPVD